MNPTQLDYLRRLQTGIYFKPAAPGAPLPPGVLYPPPHADGVPPYAMPMWGQPYPYMPSMVPPPMAHHYMPPMPMPSAATGPTQAIPVAPHPHAAMAVNATSPVTMSPDKRSVEASTLEKNIEALLLDDDSEEGAVDSPPLGAHRSLTDRTDHDGEYEGDDDEFPTLPSGAIVVETDADEIESTVRQHAKLPPAPKPAKPKAEAKSRRGRKPKAAAAAAAQKAPAAPAEGALSCTRSAHLAARLRALALHYMLHK